MRTAALPASLLLSAALATGCHSAGPYGHSKVYSPTSGETSALAAATEYDPVMAQRFPEQWRGKPVTLFAVVTNRGTGDGGAAYLTLSVRALEPRNLCDTDDEETCRVTVSDREHAKVHALLKLDAEDDLGEHSVGVGSLVRIIGAIGEAQDPSDGTPILHATFYRHWPRGFYVTSSAAGLMRR